MNANENKYVIIFVFIFNLKEKINLNAYITVSILDYSSNLTNKQKLFCLYLIYLFVILFLYYFIVVCKLINNSRLELYFGFLLTSVSGLFSKQKLWLHINSQTMYNNNKQCG